MPATNRTKLKIAAALSVLLFGLIATILWLAIEKIVTPQMALLMLIALFGLYFGFGVLIAVYRFTSKLQ
ncbi:MAG TPA: hypothetical protein VK629_07285 [Steroidobacteraceae bacterium]|nr:hypothetical protein [Steroidobacteraceae bacterium]